MVPNWPYWPYEDISVSGKQVILLATRYQQNPQSGFTTFQVDVQMWSSIMNSVRKGFYFLEEGS